MRVETTSLWHACVCYVCACGMCVCVCVCVVCGVKGKMRGEKEREGKKGISFFFVYGNLLLY